MIGERERDCRRWMNLGLRSINITWKRVFFFKCAVVQKRNRGGGIRNWQLSEGDGSKIPLLSIELGKLVDQ